MIALVKYDKGPKKVSIQEIPLPSPGIGQVRLKVKAAGVCGTDVHIYYDDSYPTKPPVVLGHECSGEIESLGDGVEDFSVGERVTTETYFYTCGKCYYCKTGRPNLCNDRLSIGSGVNGAFAEYLVVPAKNLHRLPEGISFEEAALTEPVACCAQAVFEKARILPQDVVLISGPGTMGLICLQMVKSCGANAIVTGLSKDSERLKMANKLGADLAVDLSMVSKKDFVQTIFEQTSNLGVDAVIECSGSEAAINLGLEVIKKGGTFIQLGLSGGPIAININTLTLKELIFSGTFAQKWYWWVKALELLSNKVVQVKPLISKILPIEDWEEAFIGSFQGAGIKYLLVPDKK
jgi:L-iditol 2-dehydrogenase